MTQKLKEAWHYWLPRFVFVVMLVAAIGIIADSCAGQTVNVVNYGSLPWKGWIRTTVDQRPPGRSGKISGCTFVLGRALGQATFAIDINAKLEPGEVRVIKLDTADNADFKLGALPSNPDAYWGRPMLNGVHLQLIGVEPDGAAWSAHFRARIDRMLVADLWVDWYPDWPAIVRGELVLTASNPSVEDMVATVPADLRLTWGDALVNVLGGSLPGGETMADGQSRAYPMTAVWVRHGADGNAAVLTANRSIAAYGLRDLWPNLGNPRNDNINPLAWAIQHRQGAIERLHNWDQGPLGVAATSGQTGAQEDQMFIGSEMTHGVASLGTEQVRYFVGLGQLRRPCHFLELDGRHLDLNGHPQLVIWSGRPHWHTGVSPDQLGKPTQQVGPWSHNWLGPDREHWLMNTVCVGYRATGSRALQWELQHQARLFLWQETVDPRLSTSHTDASRSVGYAGLAAYWLWHCLEDRELAKLIKERWVQRVERVYVPESAGNAMRLGLWDVRTGDQRLLQDLSDDYTMAAMLWQQGWGAYGLDLGCRFLGGEGGRELALEGALAVWRHGYTRDAFNRWIFWDVIGFTGTPLPPSEYVEGKGAHRTGWFDHTWAVPGLAVILDNDPTHDAREAWAQVTSGGGIWVPPFK